MPSGLFGLPGDFLAGVGDFVCFTCEEGLLGLPGDFFAATGEFTCVCFVGVLAGLLDLEGEFLVDPGDDVLGVLVCSNVSFGLFDLLGDFLADPAFGDLFCDGVFGVDLSAAGDADLDGDF